MVQPHKKPDQTVCPKPKERAIHDLVLLKAITAQDTPLPDTTTAPNAPPEANVFLCSILEDDPELFKIFPEEHLPMPNANTSPQVAPIMPQDDATFPGTEIPGAPEGAQRPHQNLVLIRLLFQNQSKSDNIPHFEKM